MATFTENYWDLEGLSFFCGEAEVLGGVKFRMTICTFVQYETAIRVNIQEALFTTTTTER